MSEWYWVSATYKAVDPDKPRKRHLWERTAFLIRADDGEAARSRAQQVAKDKEHEYQAKGGTVRWVLQDIEDIQSLHDAEIGDGTEVYWQFFERVDKG